MANVKVEITLTVPDSIEPEQIQEWLEFELGNRGQISMENPLESTPLVADTIEYS